MREISIHSRGSANRVRSSLGITAKAASVFALVATLTSVQAQTMQTTSPEVVEYSATEQFFNDLKTPFPWLLWGADIRFRNEYFNNALSISSANALHAQDYFRFRGRVYATATIVSNLTINARLSAEPREWMEPAYASQFKNREGMEWRYGILDVANIKLSNIFDQPLTLTLGRQDVMDVLNMRNGWIVFDGTPGDGSWTFFLDGARAAFDAKEIKTKFDVMYVSQHAYPGEVVPTIGNSSTFSSPTLANPQGNYTGYLLTEQDEQGAILSIANSSIENMTLGGFFVYKNDTRVQGVMNGDDANIYTIGGSISGTPGKHWQYWVEGAYQCGSKEDPTVNYGANGNLQPEHQWRSISAYGANARLTYLFNDRWNNQLSLVGEILSGDNPNTQGTDEMFDINWGRWPRWSELYIYSYPNETSGKIAQWNNLGRFGGMWTCSPYKGTTLSAMYTPLFAIEDAPTRTVAPGLFSFNGDFRGHYLQTIIKQQLGKHVSAHLWGEWVWEGNYYAKEQLMTFLRAEVMFTF
jgi:hypothetical protein